MRHATAESPIARRQFQQIVMGLTEGLVLVDPDGSIVWANETALSIHGCVAVDGLGADAAQYRKRFRLKYRNHHRLTARQYPVERVLAGEPFDGVVVEVSRSDDDEFHRVHELRGLVLTDARDETELLALVIKDVTERFNAEERFERTFAANPAPALICRLSDARYVKVNAGFLEMTGYASGDVVGHLFHELDVLENAEHRDDALASLRQGRTIAQQEAAVRLPDGQTKFVLVAGQPIEVGEDSCLLLTFIDLDARKRAETSLRHSEERFSKAFRLAPVPMMLCTSPELRILEVNAAFVTVTGHDPEDVVGKTTQEIGLWQQAKPYRELCDALQARREIRDFDIALRARQGDEIACLLSAETVTIQEQVCALCVLQDVTARKRSEAELVAAIEVVMKDASWFSRNVVEKLAQLRQPGSGSVKAELAALTTRERQVLESICRGQTDAEIAAALKLSRNTIRNHVAALYDKLGVNRRSAAVVWGRERGIVGY